MVCEHYSTKFTDSVCVSKNLAEAWYMLLLTACFMVLAWGAHDNDAIRIPRSLLEQQGILGVKLEE